ncbi:PqqD family peptide modification chaperone [Sorangium sp. So ce726]|uniref:PqqD family peptide modification chaperone n=1 Tax=Sorangium sp. So ce726 TaxID=3133319 RepID=UPI003F6104E5
MQLRRAFYVRKRWDGEAVYLIHLTEVLRIDAFSERVWDRLDGVTSVEEIGAALASDFPELDDATISALVAHNLITFEARGFLNPH